MFSIEKDLNNISSYSFVYSHNKSLCLILALNGGLSKKEIEGYLNLIKLLSKEVNIVLIINPNINYEIVSLFQLDNVHILRLYLENNLSRNKMFYLINNSEKIVCINNEHSILDNKKINLDLYIPNYTKSYNLETIDFNYDMYFDTAIITLHTEKKEKIINDFFTKVLKVKHTIFLYSNEKYFARFLNKDTLLVSDDKGNVAYENNIAKLKDFNIEYVSNKDNILSNILVLDSSIIIDNIFINKYKDVYLLLNKYFKDNILSVDFKVFNKHVDLLDNIIQIPYSSKHIYFEKEVEVIKKFKERK